MAKSDFAPGPWVANGTSVYTNHGGRDRPLKVCDTKQPRFTEECQHGNAALIAAAPDMLAALVGLVGKKMRGPYADINHALDAIAKARGE